MPTRPIKIMHVLAVDKTAFYFNNLVDLTDPKELVHSFANFAGENEFSQSMRSRGLQAFDLGTLNKRNLPLAFYRLWRLLRSENPQIVHTHLFDPTFVGLLAAKLQGRQTVVTRHHSDAIHVLEPRLKRRFYLWLERQNNRRADHVIALSSVVRDCVVRLEGTPEHKVSVIANPQISERYDAVTSVAIERTRAELGMDGRLALVCVSRLYPRKGQIHLFRALAPLIKGGLQARLFLVGAGEYQTELETAARDLGIADNISFLGWRDDVLDIIGAADLIVHPSLEDALSQALIESLMLAKPIIATDISGAGEILDNGRFGTLVQPADIDGLRIAISDTLHDLDAARERARGGREYLLSRMDGRRVLADYGAIYRKLVERTNGGS